MGSAEPGAERDLGVGTVDAEHPPVGDQCDPADAGDELAEPLERPDCDVDAAGREHDVVGVTGGGVGTVAVEPLALVVERLEPLPVAC